jgi:hypothetical protein
LRERLEEQTKLAQERRRRMRLAVAGAVLCGFLTVVATGGFLYALYHKLRADQAVIETNASSLWSRLQLWRDPLTRDDVATLWELTQGDEDLRVAFVRQLANDHRLLRQFGYKPQAIGRAVGLRWPEDALETAKRSMTYVASDQFDPTDPFELVSYTRALAALAPWLDPEIANRARQNIQSVINDLAEQEPLGDPQLWALPETVEVFGARLEPPVAIEPARDRLRHVIRSAVPPVDASWRDHAISRAIQVMAPVLNDQERRQAVRYVVPLLGETPDLWSAKAIPRALIALLPTLEPGDLNRVPAAIASLAVANLNGDSSYLLALMQLTEKLGSMDDGKPVVAAFSRALARQLGLPMEPAQRAALARATVPLLERQSESLPLLVRTVAAITLPQQGTPLRAEDALRQALPGSDGPPQRAQAAFDLLHADWTAQPTANASPNPYRRAAQARLLAMFAPLLTPDLAVRAAEDLLIMLPAAPDYLSREAIARALAALAPQLPDAERNKALSAAKVALAKTGSTEEATAWAGAIAALLPAEPRAATAEVVEALKYPTAVEAPSNVLLAALAERWEEGPETQPMPGVTLPNLALLDWLEAHLPEGHNLADPPSPPPDLQSGDARPDPG